MKNSTELLISRVLGVVGIIVGSATLIAVVLCLLTGGNR